jgi:DNA-binding transcriptional LysR family regulator
MAKEVPNLAETRARTAAGRLPRLSVPRAVVPILLEPLIASFCRAYPEVEVEIAASEELIDLAAEGFDAGIRLGQFIAADMVAVRLMKPFRFIIVGSPAYLARSGRPSARTVCADDLCDAQSASRNHASMGRSLCHGKRGAAIGSCDPRQAPRRPAADRARRFRLRNDVS